jgi:hypothetical protein
MIISYKKKFVFVHIYKTAGTSIFSIFGRYGKISSLISEVWPTRFFFKLVNVLFKLDDYGNSWINGVHKHASCLQIFKYMGRKNYNNFYKFAFVRNPYDLLYSLWNYEKKTRTHKNFQYSNSISFEEFVDNQIINRAPCQVDFLTINGKISVDYIGYFEYLDESIQDICTQLKVPFYKLPKLNSSNRENEVFERIYSKELANKVYKYYKEDFEVFGYSKDFRSFSPKKDMGI